MKFDSALAHAQRGREGGREGGRVTKNTGVSAASVRDHGFGSDLVEGVSTYYTVPLTPSFSNKICVFPFLVFLYFQSPAYRVSYEYNLQQ